MIGLPDLAGCWTMELSG